MSGVTAIIPNWNRSGFLARVLEDLRQQSRPPEEVLVIDNGSTDDSAALAEAAGARVIQLGRNAGFSAAVNRGVREARTDWVAVLNNDLQLRPDWLEKLLAAASSVRWYATGKILSAEHRGTIDGTFDTLSLGACPWRAGHGRPDGPIWDQGAAIRFVPLTAGVFRRQLFDEVGELDERFESYLEDVEFSVRCALGGYTGSYVPEAVCYHYGSVTLGVWHSDTVRRISRNQILIVAKHFSNRMIARYSWKIVVGQLLWGMLALRRGRGIDYLLGKWEGCRQFSRFRRDCAARASRAHPLAEILRDSEGQIREIQSRTGFDWYWRLYFLLT